MVTSSTLQSIRDLQPLENGGVVARQGFTFQDHVAVNFCLQMLDGSLKEVWCEAFDDITLIYDSTGQETVEFVQVKDVELGQFWSVAKLCERQKNQQNPVGPGTSILERSLAHDRRIIEPCGFRIVTSLDVNAELKSLKYPLSSPNRLSPGKPIKDLIKLITDKLPGIQSPNQHGCDYWVENTVWDVLYNQTSVEDKNILLLVNWINSRISPITSDLVKREIYPKILEKVKKAAEIDWQIAPEQKKILKNDFSTWLLAIVDQAISLHYAPAGVKLREKMEKVNIPNDYILTALEERQLYRQENIAPTYLDLSDQRMIQAEVLNTLAVLRSKMDNGDIPEGFTFYKECLDQLGTLTTDLPTHKRPLHATLSGCMHDIVDRCAHRYHKEIT